MRLFLDRFRLHTWTDNTRSPAKTYWSVVVPLLVTDFGALTPPANTPVRYWALDSANTGEAFAWRHHLLAAGLDPDLHRTRTGLTITTSVGSKAHVPVRTATLWLVSNLPEFQGNPWPIDLDGGIPFRDVPTLPDPNFNRPLVGIRALREGSLKVEIDLMNDTVSVWIPDSLGQTP